MNTEVSQCTWLEDEGLWEVQLEHLLPGIGDLSSKARQRKVDELGRSSVIVATEIVKAKIVISAVGGLVEPKDWPREIPGREKFQGDIFHSARWDSTISFKDKHVVVLGTGCSAAQFVPKLIERPYDAKKVTQLMRSPPWVQPRVKPPFGDKGWATWGPWLLTNIPGLARLLRTLMFLVIERDFRLFGGGEYHAKERGKTERALLRYMKKTVPAKYHAILTPDYEVGCKRRIFDSKWFPSLKDARVELSTLPLRSLDARSITIGPGCLYRGPGDLNSDEKSDAEERVLPADIIILANGFDVANWSHPLVVKGRNGLELIDVMMQRGGPQAYQGTAMDGFPNFLIIFGPNTATGHSSVILATENMVNYALNFVRLVLQGDATMFEIKRTAEMQYTADIQLKLKNTVFMSGGCQSWYFTKDGWNATALP